MPEKEIKYLPKNKAWFTTNTELLTEDGWVPIEEVIQRGLKLITLNTETRRTRVSNILSVSTMPFKGEIQYFEYSNVYMEFRYGLPIPKSDYLPSFEGVECNIYGRTKYKGTLYCISVPDSTVFVRHPKISHSGPSIHAKTAVLLAEDDRLDDGYIDIEEDETIEEVDPATGLSIFNVLTPSWGAIIRERDGLKNKAGKKKKQRGNRRYQTLNHPNYYPCRVSW